MNKIKEELRFRLQGQLSSDKTEVDVNVAYDVVEKVSVSFSNFLAENYHTEFETWTGNSLPKGKVQNRKTYDIVDITETFKTYVNEI
jgi:hypothetical protein